MAVGTDSSKWIRRRETILLLLIILIGAFLRFYDIGAESLWLDEAASIREAAMSIKGMVAHSNQPPLYFLILNLWIKLFGTGEAALRSLSAIFGIISLLLMYLIGSILFTRRIGLLACFLSAISSFHIRYSQEVRGYSLLLLLALVSYYFFIKIIKQNKKWHYICYLLASILLGYVHIFGLLIISSQVLFFILFWNKYRAQRVKFLSTIGIIILAYLPLAYLLYGNVQRIVNSGFWIPMPELNSILKTLMNFSGWGNAGIFIFLVFLLLAINGFFSKNLVAGKWNWRSPLESLKDMTWKIRLESIEEELLLMMWLSVSIVVPFIISKFITPIYLTKYIIGATPALYLIVAKGIGNISKKWLFYPVLIFIFLLSSFGLQSYYKNDIRDQWRETADFVEINSNNNDVIVFTPGYLQNPFNYYYQGDLLEFGFSSGTGETQEIDDFLDDTVQAKDRVWLILYRHNKKSLLRSYMIDRYGSQSIIIEKDFVGISVFLFDSD